MKTKFKIGDPIIMGGISRGRIKDIEQETDGSIWYVICWHQTMNIIELVAPYVDSNYELDIKQLREDRLSELLDK